MKVVTVRRSAPFPLVLPTTVSLSQGMAPCVTTTESVATKVLAQTALASFEDCHVARMGWYPVNGSVLTSSGLGLKKCVMSCFASPPTSLNSVASGVNSFQANTVLPAASTPDGRQT